MALGKSKSPATKEPSAPKTQRTTKFKFASAKRSSQKGRQEKPETLAGSGTILLSKAAPLGKIAAWVLVLVITVGAAFGWKQMLNPPAEAAPVFQPGYTAEEQQAGDYARSFVASWLRATRTDAAGLDRYMPIGQGDISQEEPIEFRDLATASVETDEQGISTVIISAALLVTEDSEGNEDGEKPKGSWETNWFQVNVSHQKGTFSVLQWPAPVAAPVAGAQMALGYKYEGSPEIGATVDAFFKAYVLGEGDVDRLTSPKSSIEALGTNPYKVASVSKVLTTEDHRDEVPKEGTTARALVAVSLGNKENSGRAASYVLTLETRGGRWEVKSIDSAPLLSAAPIEAEAKTSE